MYRSKLIYKIIIICLLVVSLISQRFDLCFGYTYHVRMKSAVMRTIYTGYTYHSHFQVWENRCKNSITIFYSKHSSEIPDMLGHKSNQLGIVNLYLHLNR